ncbi:MAG: helix-hairpin-helix domain-containing protein [Eubacterium sp.]|nr:helix-hairpin-helix domain-containing protein [Eubacterium sp.]
MISIGGQESRTETGEQKQPVSGQNPEENTGSGDSWVYVHVCGCVNNPGLYRLARGQRIDAAIRRAGGFTREADTKSVNLASLLEDGSQIEVLSIDSGGSDDSSRKDKRVNINLAGKEDLMTLHGIGESRALAIIAYREEHGGFSSVEELKEVEGIGDGIYQKIKNTIRI